MLTIDNHNCIRLTRGDSACLDIELKNDNGEEYIMDEGDFLKLTIKESASSDNIIIQKKSNTNQISLSPSDTNDLKYRNYVYDIELNTNSGDVYTVVPISTFKICEEVG